MSSLWMARAEHFPAPMASMTVAEPVTMSPPAKTSGMEVWPVSGSASMYPHLLQLQFRQRRRQKRIGTGADGHNHQVHLQLELGALDGDGAAPAAVVRLAQLHLQAFHTPAPSRPSPGCAREG